MEQEKAFTFFMNTVDVRHEMTRPLCREMDIPQPAFSILMFLADNPEYDTAKDVGKFCALKPNIVSFNVEKLVLRGFLERRPVPGDRRSVSLVCTEKAKPFIERGHVLCQKFAEVLWDGVTDEEKAVLHSCWEKMNQNLIQYKNREKSEGKTDA